MQSAPERFWSKVAVGGLDECWQWQASRHVYSGHGQFAYYRKPCGAHRMSWWLAYGEIPPGYDIHHTCENPPCVNPAHLQLLARGTHQLVTIRSYGGAMGITAVNAAKTACPEGHTYDELASGSRSCSQCRRARAARGYRQRAARNSAERA